ncbi:26961_t:CDS:2 [Dentiscutata erythropus]|uniref:26961_t:CDS:1 n=1 Tax=Dentiscutata erythropus TaxID=1348616 RepID=A0A9N8ZQX7_9GLOM|nr:26961_t:CDS:2 [Dentiscutata erythropus]
MSRHGFVMRKDQVENTEHAFNVENAPEIAFKLDENKVKTVISQRNFEETKQYEHEFDVVCNRSLVTYNDISTIFPWLSDLLKIPKKSLKNSTINFKKVEKAEIFISKKYIILNKNFKEGIENILDSHGSAYDKIKNLRKIVDKYDYFYARHIVFGGAIVTENSKSKIIEYNDIHPIFDLLDDELKIKVLDVLGHRILKAGVKEIDPNYDFSKNIPYVYPLANEIAELDKITDIHNCRIFASIRTEDEDGDIFSLRVDYINIHTPQVVVHLITRSKNKKHRAKINWIIIGQPNYFDFNQTASLRSSEHFAYKIGKKFKVDIPKYDATLSSEESCILYESKDVEDVALSKAKIVYVVNNLNFQYVNLFVLLNNCIIFINSFVDISESNKKYPAGQIDINWKESEIHPHILYSTNDIYKKKEALVLVNQLFEDCENHGFINISSEKNFYRIPNKPLIHSEKIAYFVMPE